MKYGIRMDNMIREVKKLLKSVVVKDNDAAKVGETLDIRKESDRYLMVKDGADDFTSYAVFDREVYLSAGVPEQLINTYNDNKDMIPYSIRNTLLYLQRQYILNNYVEKNNYYRMLAGLPDYDDITVIYVPKNDFEIPTTIPIHQLNTSMISKLESTGILATIIADNPTKKYLNYLGEKSITVYKARKALNYELLYNYTTNPENIGTDFKRFYAMSREYVMTVIHNRNLATTYEYYNNFMAFCILIMAAQRLFNNVYSHGISRDFYDIQLVKYLYDSYNIPFFDNMTIDQHRLLVKNLNVLLSSKSNTKVIYNLCALFGFANINVYKYFLVKDHIKDDNGNPVFFTKENILEDGTKVTVPDYEKMYNLYFQKMNFKETDVISNLDISSNRLDYLALTASDPYWVDDEALRNKIYSNYFNYAETKYISMDIMFKITEMMYEICHTFRMILDNQSEFKKIKLDIPKLSNKSIDLFTLIIFICALFCKRYKFNGEIPLGGPTVANVLGFNFRADMETIRQDILTNKLLDSSMGKYLLDFNVADKKDVAKIYNNIKALKDFIVNRIYYTKDIDQYRAYIKLYKSILVVEDIPAIYTKSDKTIATTYADLLTDLNPELKATLDNFTNNRDMITMIEHVLYKIEALNSSYKYLHLAVDVEAIFNILTQLINFFKSYTVDLTSAGILYLFDDRYFNILKVLDKIVGTDVTMCTDDKLKIIYSDMIKTMTVSTGGDTRIKNNDWLDVTVLDFIKDKIGIRDTLEFTNHLNFKDNPHVQDYLKSLTTEITRSDKIPLRDEMRMEITYA